MRSFERNASSFVPKNNKKAPFQDRKFKDCSFRGEAVGDTHVLSVPEVMSSVTRMMHLWPFTVDFQESWKRTMFGCCRPFSISTSSLKRCRSALVSLRVCRFKKKRSHCDENVCMLFMRYSISLFSSRTSFTQSDVMSLLLSQDIFWLRPEHAVVAEICKLSLFLWMWVISGSIFLPMKL